MGSPRDRWPLGRGFERYYGFMGGETDQFHPDLVYDNHPVEPPRTPEEGYHLTEDLADKAILFLKDLRATAPEKPFFLWFTPGACHAPHQAPRGVHRSLPRAVRQGLGPLARRRCSRASSSPACCRRRRSCRSDRPGCRRGTRCRPRSSASAARMMEVFAGFLTHTDAQVARLLDFIAELGELDNTIVLVMSDNGASAEGGAKGSFNEQYFFNLVPESLEENLRRIDDLGSPLRQQPLPVGLGVGGEHAAQAVQARHARRWRCRSADRALAERHRHRR